jgi:hypothetical protein
VTGGVHVGAIVITSSTPLWYATRATGLVALVLLTASMALGLLSSVRFQRSAWPRFVTLGLHRNLSLLALGFTAVHGRYDEINGIKAGPLSPHWSTRSGTRTTPTAGAARPDHRVSR